MKRVLSSHPRLLAGWLLLIVSAQSQAHAQTNARDDGPVVMRAALSHAAYTASFPETLSLKIDLAAGVDQMSQQRPPLNLALVIDRSGSMADGGKIDYAMQAARLVVENLSERDIVSVIAFNQEATVLSPAGLAVNRTFLNHRLDEVVPDGRTNLSAGLLEAFAQIDGMASEGQIKRAIVLTDGKANQGVTDVDGLRRLVDSARRRGIGVSTMGCGEEFDEQVLMALADAGGGRYTYIRSPEQIPDAMSAELGGLLHVMAQNVTVEVTARTGLDITGVDGWLIAEPSRSFTFNLGDVREGDRGVLLIKLAPRDFVAGDVARIDCTISLDRTDTGERQRHVVRIEAVMLDDESLVLQSADQSVVFYADLIDAVSRAEEAVLGLDEDSLRNAVKLFEQHYEAARRFAIDTRDQQLLNQTFMLKHFMTELAVASETGLVHRHEDAQRQLRREVEYQRYLRTHHRIFNN